MASQTRRVLLSAVAAGAVLALSSSARAGFTIWDNLNEPGPNHGSDSIYESGPLADSFTTGNDVVKLTAVQLLLEGVPSGGFVTVSLLSDNSTYPGTVLTTGNASDGGLLHFEQYTYPTVVQASMTTPYTLLPNTRYWIELTTTNSSASWDWAQTPSFGEYIYNPYYGVIPTLPPGANGGRDYQMAVIASPAVPEPATIVVFSVVFLAAGGFGLYRRRRGASESRPTCQK